MQKQPQHSWGEEVGHITAYSPEIEIASKTHGYHGRADLLVQVENNDKVEWHIIDWKTTADENAKGPYANVALQVNAYANAESYRASADGNWRPMPHVSKAWGVTLLPDGTYIADEVLGEKHWEAFYSARTIADWKANTKVHGSHANIRVKGGKALLPTQSTSLHS